MSVAVETPREERGGQFSFAKLIGPGLIVAAAGIGAGDIVSSTMAGANLGLTLLWAVALTAVLKSFLNEGIGRWQLATGTTAIEGWCIHLPWWVRAYFGVYLLLWAVSVTAALTGATGLGLSTLTGGAVPRPVGAVLHSILGGLLVLVGGFRGFEKVMKVLIVTMFFAIITCAVFTFPGFGPVAKGLLIPSIPPGAGPSVLSVLGGIGGSVSMLAYNYWLREEKMVGPGWLRYIRNDVSIAYVFTALFGISVMIVANQAFHVPGIQITNAQAVTRMAETLGAILGPFGFYVYAVGFWAAVFASLLGVWQSLPYMLTDYYGLLRKYPREKLDQMTQVSSRWYRLSLAFVVLVPMPFAFIDQPLFVIRTFTIVGSLFMPFLAATLLYLNNVRIPSGGPVPRNGVLANVVLVLCLALFGLVGAREAGLLRF